MQKEEFENRLISGLQAVLPAGWPITAEMVSGAYGRKRALTVQTMQEGVKLVIGIDDLYEKLSAGGSIEYMVSQIAKEIHGDKFHAESLKRIYGDWDLVKEHVVRRLLPRSTVTGVGDSIPWKPFLDMALVYYCELDLESEEAGRAGIMIRNEHMQMWKASREDLDRAAAVCQCRMDPYIFISMSDMLEELLDAKMSAEEKENTLYVLTNSSRCFGAAAMTDREILEKLADRLEDDFYILPSSVHECIAVPLAQAPSAAQLSSMVYQINRTEVAPDEVLGDSVYIYERENRAVRIV